MAQQIKDFSFPATAEQLATVGIIVQSNFDGYHVSYYEEDDKVTVRLNFRNTVYCDKIIATYKKASKRLNLKAVLALLHTL